MALPQSFLDELRARLTLSTIIGRRVKLIRAGREYKACCPFHNEKTPSFTVNDDKGFYHCLAGDTGVVVRDGVAAIRDLAGGTHEVLTRGGVWVRAPFRSYGVQRLWRIRLSRNGQSKTLYATSGHRWFVRGVRRDVLTTALRPGHRLESVLPAVEDDWTLDPDGVRHGFVFGDGSVAKGGYGHVHLHGAKDLALAAWFPDQAPVARVTDAGRPYLRIYGGRAFGHMKALPSLDAPRAYLLGVLAGYLAADGHVAKDGTVMLNSAERRHLEWVRAAAHRLGIGTYGITTASRRGFGADDSDLHRVHFVPATLRPELFLLEQARQRFTEAAKRFARLRWVVQAVEETEREEEVFCAEVPGEHAFALEDNILTGNCFGCGAHGDVITFEMETGNLSFPEAVEKLATEAGLEVPRASPQEVEQQKRRAGVLEVVEAACAFFEQQLRMPVGKEGLAYLHRRGLDDATIARFRLGYAPRAGALKAAMAHQEIDEEQLVEAGLLKRRDDGSTYDYFRDRVMFPITDRRGRPIAFGGRILGDGQPKYLNSPDTPLFHKGTVLYGLAQAREAAGKNGEIIVAEGYMDVIALARAGFGQSVAPLGTALTESQIEELWRLADEPILCFDADAAGQRAAYRAAERALAILRPGKSLRFALMKSPSGGSAKDPDDLIREEGAGAMRKVLESARPLLDVLWSQAVEGRMLDTPERRAALERDIHGLVGRIADRSVQGHYRQAVKDRLFRLFRPPRQAGGGGFQAGGGARPGRGRGRVGRPGAWAEPVWSAPLKPVAAPESIDALQKRILLATLVTHPDLVDHVGERLGALDFAAGPLDRLRGRVLAILGREPSLDFTSLRDHLRADGCGEELESLLTSNVYTHAAFARPEADSETARHGWDHTFGLLIRRKELKADLDHVVERLGENPTAEDFETFLALQRHMHPPDED